MERFVWIQFNVYQSDAPLEDPASERKMQMAVRSIDIVAFQEVLGIDTQSFIIVKVEDEPSKALRVDVPFLTVFDSMNTISR
jgi:hypothetical protein